MTVNVLFMCPHSAGKSLAAATYFRAAAGRRGLDVSVAVAGPDPDDVNMTTVVEALMAQGYRIDWQPHRVTAEDTTSADVVVSIGCDPEAIPGGVAITEWDVPLISQDLLGSLQAINEHVENLVGRLAGSRDRNS